MMQIVWVNERGSVIDGDSKGDGACKAVGGNAFKDPVVYAAENGGPVNQFGGIRRLSLYWE